MRIKIKTKIGADINRVKELFNEDLFLSLNPPFPPVKLLEFGGCVTGDRVTLQLNFLLFKQKWVSKIIADDDTPTQWYFIDQGVELPFFLKSWTHKHVVEKSREGSVVIDDITYTTGTLLTDYLMYPVLLGQFMYRQPVYKKLLK